MTPADQFKALVDMLVVPGEQIHGRDESHGAQRMFASTSIKTGGKMFAFLHKKARLVVKLPEDRVAELVASGQGERFDPGDERLQREWLVVRSDSAGDWLTMAAEAEAYVGKR